MLRFQTIWDVTPETAHPRARELLAGSVVWNYGDEDSPLGTDTGADTFADYMKFHQAKPDGRIQEFISDQLDKRFDVLIRDDFIIGLAFAQILLEGRVDPEVKHYAIFALHRQAMDAMLAFRGGGAEQESKRQFAEFRRILELV